MPRKQRKRVSRSIPAKGRLRDIADRLWSKAVLANWAGKCAVCGARKCHAHHLIPRQHQATRYDLWNGISLCAPHHQFDPDISPHQNAAGWMEYLFDNHRTRSQWYIENKRKPFDGTTNAAYYCEVIRRLKQYIDEDVFENTCGIRFAAWLDSRE